MTGDAQTVIFLVRHGETDFPYSANPDTDGERKLTEKGRQQSEHNGQYLRDFAPAAIYSSPLQRTLETAEIIKKVAGISGAVVTGQDLYEIYDDRSYHSIGTRLPRFFNELIGRHGGEQIVCVSHQDVIQGVLRSLGATADECDFPCQVGQMYRVVFAGKVFVQAAKLKPAYQ